MTLSIKWIDRHREPKCPPNPAFPEGVDVDVSDGARSCQTPLPYPAPRCGVYVVTCDVCGYAAGFTTAGRPDDPRSVRVPCKAAPQSERRL